MEPDEVIAERYRLQEPLGEGGSATVWLAHDVVLDRTCALKMLISVAGQAHRERLRAEARVLATLDHRHVVRVWDQGQHDGQDFIVMEYLPGGSLADRLTTDGPLVPVQAVDLILQILDALGAAHEAGIVHRDVKPANVLLREADQAALCDFGIARQETLSAGTRTGVALGSVGYMAPEQRIDARRAGPGADLYATACTLFNLVTDDTPVDLYLAPDHSPRWGRLPAPLRPVLRKATQAEPEQRYLSAEEMADALRVVRAALESVPAAERRMPPGAGYVPTAMADPVVSVAAASRERAVAVEDWRRERAGGAAGRQALWVGAAAVIMMTVAGLAAGPVLEDLEARMTASETVPAESVQAAEPEPPPPPGEAMAVRGRWIGNLDGAHPMQLTLSGSGEVLLGEVVLTLGTHRMRSSVRGGWTSAGQELSLKEDGTATLRARPGPSRGILVGELHREADDSTLPFALVWVGAEE
ncbi:MAG: serine/threonine protein kinase [Myxococcales bacterium]|nr:serine/threonine protein kinase [Myxococcales bacterium]